MSSRDRILDAAAELIRDLGLAHATTKQIALAAGVSEGTIYKQFQDKEELVGFVLSQRMPEFIPVLKQLRAGTRTVRDNLVELATLAIGFYRETLPILASLFSEPSLLENQRRVARTRNTGPHKAREAVATYLEAEQSAGRLLPGDPTALADLLLGACFQRAFLDSFLGEKRADAHATAAALVDTLLSGRVPASAS